MISVEFSLTYQCRFPDINSKPLRCFTAAEIAAKDLSYAKLSMTNPKGWTDDDIHLVKNAGFSVAGIHYLNPSPERYNSAGLIQIMEEVTPHMLD